MIIGVPKDQKEGETRIPLIPGSIKKLLSKFDKLEFWIEKGIGESIHISDEEYTAAGGTLKERKEILSCSDLVLRLSEPSVDEIKLQKKGSMALGLLDPFNGKELVEAFKTAGISAFSMQLIPRTTKAQKMDALSSQASLAGYAAVSYASSQLEKIFPMMMTPAGTISPSRVFIIGAGVAGLQAIATAKRLGARVEAYDTRPVVEEQVKSLGAKFVKVDLGDTGQTKDGYAKALTEEQLEKQRKVMADHAAAADVVITTAKLFGRTSPVILTKDMVERMNPGSLIVDLAAETGGNVELTNPGEVIEHKGVTICGLTNFEGRIPVHASQMFSANLLGFIEEFYDGETDSIDPQGEDEILTGSLITHNGEIVNQLVLKVYGGQ